MLEEYIKPLKKTFVDNNQHTDYDSLDPSTKRMLVLCAEVGVHMTEIPFAGRIMATVKKILKQDDTSLSCTSLFHVPSNLLTEIPVADQAQTGLPAGITGKVLFIPTDLVESEENENRTSPTNTYLQMYQRKANDSLNLPNDYMKYVSNCLCIIWKACWLDENNTPLPNAPFISLLDQPDFLKVSLLTINKKKEMMHQLMKQLARLYDLEWYKTSLEKTKKMARLGNARNVSQDDETFFGSKRDFPTTKSSLYEFVAGKTYLSINSVVSKSITSKGKSTDDYNQKGSK
jgi:hypothetical protein